MFHGRCIDAGLAMKILFVEAMLVTYRRVGKRTLRIHPYKGFAAVVGL